MTTYITFGYNHSALHPWIGDELHQGYLAIELGPDIATFVERDVAFALLGPKWAFSYGEKPGDRYPKGEVARLVLINEADLENYRRQVDYTHEIADHDDDHGLEIEGLQRARDMLAEIIGHTPARGQARPSNETPSTDSRAQSGEW